MDMEIDTDNDNKRLNRLVAITVVLLSVFGAVTIKDDNIVQAVQKAKSESVDAGAEYQAARVKLHVDENGLLMLRLLDDQFDLSDAFLATAIAVAAVVSRLDPASGVAIAAFERLRARPQHACVPTIDIL
jgi:uncharacterized protein DUF4337